MSEIKVTYVAVEIKYNEYRNNWVFIVGGKEYTVESLRLAREKIDAVIAKERLAKRKRFEPITAYTCSGKRGRITSLNEMGQSWRRQNSEVMRVRFKTEGEKGPGSVEEVCSLVKDTPKNVALFKEIRELKDRTSKLEEQLVYMVNDDVPAIED